MRFNPNIDEDKTPRELLATFYKDYGLSPDGGQSDSRVKIEVFKNVYFYIPNFPARKKAVPLHDIHHLLTQYSSHFIGESEISAWEIASGCKKHLAALAIDASGMMMGLGFDLPGIYRAFVRGRRSANLYHETISLNEANDITIKDLRLKLHIPPPDSLIKATFKDLITFIVTVSIAGIYSLLSIAFLVPLLLYNLILLVTGAYRK